MCYIHANPYAAPANPYAGLLHLRILMLRPSFSVVTGSINRATMILELMLLKLTATYKK